MKSSGFAAFGLAVAMAGLAVTGPAAQAQTYAPPPYHHHHRHYVRYNRYNRSDRSCEEARRSRANSGTAIGAVGGGILGSALGGGHLGNTLLGAGAGAVAGHEIAKRGVRC